MNGQTMTLDFTTYDGTDETLPDRNGEEVLVYRNPQQPCLTFFAVYVCCREDRHCPNQRLYSSYEDDDDYCDGCANDDHLIDEILKKGDRWAYLPDGLAD
jgi:hypothetical protein